MGMHRHLLAASLPLLARCQGAKAEQMRAMLFHATALKTIETLRLPMVTFTGAYLMSLGQISYGEYALAAAMAALLAQQVDKVGDSIRKHVAMRPIARLAEEVTTDSLYNSPHPTGSREQESAPLDPTALIQAQNLGFGHGYIVADFFRDIDLRIRHGEVVGIVGQSGSGKTTLLELLSGQRPLTTGRIYFDGQLLTGPAPAGFVFADDEFVEGSLNDFLTGGKKADCERILKALRMAELEDRLGLFVDGDARERLEEQGLSRGEIQRLLLAQALYRSDRCVFFDEAFSHLSAEQSARIIDRLRMAGVTLVLATHRPEIIALCDRCVTLRR
jgi:ABC-type bacteriocin/lantibiotic exporter with double-glycine peptidase domain